MRRVAVAVAFSSVALAMGDPGLPPALEEQAARMVQGIEDSIHRLEGLTAMTTKALEPAVHRAHAPKPERRLADSQCAWSGDACAPDSNFMSWLMPNSSALRGMLAEETACMELATESACEAAGLGCIWRYGECEKPMDAESMQMAMGALFPADQCGWISGVAASACPSYSASDPTQCSQAKGCRSVSAWEPVGQTCVEQATCQPAGMALICPSLTEVNMTARVESCAAFAMAVMTMLHAPNEHSAFMSAMLKCVFEVEGCPLLSDANGRMQAAIPTCMALTTISTCSANTDCSWQPGLNMCGPDMMKFVQYSTPAGCPLKLVMEKIVTCEGQDKQSTCSQNSACQWEAEVTACEGPTLQAQSKCGVSMAAIMSDLAAHGSSDAAALANVALVEASCGAQKDEASCTGASVALVTAAPAEDTVSSSGRRAAATASSAELAALLLAAATWVVQK